MSKHLNNIGKIVEEILSVEAWHDTIHYQTETDLFLAVSFREGRFQGGDKQKVAFTVKLNRAEICIELDEYLKVNQSSILRQFPKVEYSTSKGETASKGATHSSNDSFNSELSLSPSFSASSGQAKDQSESASTNGSINRKFDWPIETFHSKTKAGSVWTAKPLKGAHLEGQVFDSEKAILSFSAQSEKGLDARHVKIIVRCKAEDFAIDEDSIELLDGNLITKFTPAGLRRRKKLAAEVLKNRIVEHGLELVELSDKYNDVILAMVMSNE